LLGSRASCSDVDDSVIVRIAPHRGLSVPSKHILWTNKSVLKFAGDTDPFLLIEAKARELVLKARDSGWSGPPYNPLGIADLLKIRVEANSDVVDARTVAVRRRHPDRIQSRRPA